MLRLKETWMILHKLNTCITLYAKQQGTQKHGKEIESAISKNGPAIYYAPPTGWGLQNESKTRTSEKQDTRATPSDAWRRHQRPCRDEKGRPGQHQ